MKQSEVRVLIVEDDPNLSEALVGLFKSFGFLTTTASNGFEALVALEKSECHAVLTDIRMPKMDGVTLLKTIRGRNRQWPKVMIISGYADYSAEDLFEMGADGYFVKPFASSVVRDALKKALVAPAERWSHAPTEAIHLGLAREYQSFERIIESGEVKFGNGGFSIALNAQAPPVGSKVRFSFAFNEGAFRKIDGTGTVRWVRTFLREGETKALGVEFDSIHPEIHAEFSRWLRDRNFLAYIPKF